MTGWRGVRGGGCHSEPVLTLAWESLFEAAAKAVGLPHQSADWCAMTGWHGVRGVRAGLALSFFDCKDRSVGAAALGGPSYGRPKGAAPTCTLGILLVIQLCFSGIHKRLSSALNRHGRGQCAYSASLSPGLKKELNLLCRFYKNTGMRYIGKPELSYVSQGFRRAISRTTVVAR